MSGILEGKEVEGKIGDVADYYIDVDEAGKVVVSLIAKKVIDSHTSLSSENKVETDLFVILEKITAKTKTTLDDKAVATIKAILGMI